MEMLGHSQGVICYRRPAASNHHRYRTRLDLRACDMDYSEYTMLYAMSRVHGTVRYAATDDSCR